MPYRPEAELKRPDLKGEFVCATCHKTFCHAASLNRHRLNFHGGNHFCTICNEVIPFAAKDTVRRHMSEHGYERIFTCGCCNWAFPDKKELHIHTSSMAKFNEPGSARVIATTAAAEGETPATGVFKEPKRIREARAAAKAASTPSPRASSGESSKSPTKAPSWMSPPVTGSSIPPQGVMPTLAGSAEFCQLIAQLMQRTTVSPAFAAGFIHNNPFPLPGQTSDILSLLSSLSSAPSPSSLSSASSTLPTVLPQSTVPSLSLPSSASSLLTTPLAAIDTLMLSTACSGLPSASAHSEAQDTESDRVSSPSGGDHSPPLMGMKGRSHLHEGLLMAASDAENDKGVDVSGSPMSLDVCSSPSSHGSPSYEEKMNNNAGSSSGGGGGVSSLSVHPMTVLISPTKMKHDSCSSSDDASPSSPEQRNTPSPGESRKRRRTINDVVSFLHTKKVKVEE